ncbi:MAG: D-glycero-alpha-D-manno-heptose-1,7-bisphosphate 7-phosphatase [Nitrososphaeria archaeon]
MSSSNKAVFLDRDGVICYDVHYMSSPDQFTLMPGVGEGIQKLNEMGFLVIVVTNQSGLKRGLITEDNLKKIHERMISELSAYGARIDDIFVCPCLPEDDCECRKPKPGMILEAARKHSIDLKSSYMIGDKQIDSDAGKAAGCKTILITEDASAVADFKVKNFIEAVEIIIKEEKKDEGILGYG